MFFTKAATVIAWLFFVPCVVAYLPILIASLTGFLPELAEAAGAVYVRSHGEFVKGILLGVAFGIASEISKHLAAKRS